MVGMVSVQLKAAQEEELACGRMAGRALFNWCLLDNITTGNVTLHQRFKG